MKNIVISGLFAVSALSAQAQEIFDFTTVEYQAVQGQTSFDFGDIEISTVAPDKLTWNGFGDGTKGDGIGVENDEITGNQGQQVVFDFTDDVFVTAVDFLDLFEEGDSVNGAEAGSATFTLADNSTQTIDFDYTTNKGWASQAGFVGDSTNGDYGDATIFVNFDQAVKSITFTAQDDNWSDYAVARIRTSAGGDAPFAPSVVVFGMMGFAFSALRRK